MRDFAPIRCSLALADLVHLLEILEDPAPTDANPGSIGETNAPPGAASAPTTEAASETASEAASETPHSRARMMQDWDQGPPWESELGRRQRGRRSAAALGVVPVDVRRTPQLPPERLTEAEKVLWEELIASRRANWFAGAEGILECYVTTVSHLHQLEAWLAEVQPEDERYVELMRLRLGLVGQLSSLAVKLRLTPSSRLDRRTPQTGMFPVA